MSIVKTALLYYDRAIRDGSIRKAAENLHVASSAVNRQILKLEEELGVELFVRLPRGIQPTSAGEALLACIRRWKREAGHLRQEIERMKGGVRGTIRLAFAESLATELLPQAMRRLNERYPLIDFTLVSGDNLRIRSELRTRDADVVCAFDVGDNVRTVHTTHAPVGVVMPVGHELAEAENLAISDCLPYRIIALDAEWLKHSTLGELFEEGRLPFRIAARVERIGMLKDLVRTGLGIAFLSRIGLDRDIAEGRLAWVPLTRGSIRPVAISLLVQHGRVQSAHVSTFVEIMKEEMARLG